MKGKETKQDKTSIIDAETALKRIGERIKDLRSKKGYTSYEYFAYEHHISRAQFGRYEKGQDLRMSSFIKVLNSLEISFADFFSEGFEEPKK